MHALRRARRNVRLLGRVLVRMGREARRGVSEPGDDSMLDEAQVSTLQGEHLTMSERHSGYESFRDENDVLWRRSLGLDERRPARWYEARRGYWNLLVAAVCAGIGTWLIERYGCDGALYYFPVMMIGLEIQR